MILSMSAKPQGEFMYGPCAGSSLNQYWCYLLLLLRPGQTTCLLLSRQHICRGLKHVWLQHLALLGKANTTVPAEERIGHCSASMLPILTIC